MQEAYSKHQTVIMSKVHRFSEDNCLDIVETIRRYKLYHSTRVFNAQQYMSLLNTYSDHRAMESKSRKALEDELTDLINQFGGTH